MSTIDMGASNDLIPWQRVFMVVSARALLRNFTSMGGPSPGGAPPPTPEEDLANAIRISMDTHEIAIHTALLRDLRNNRETHNHFVGYADQLPRKWEIEPELSYLGKAGETNRRAERVDLAFCRRIDDLKDSTTGDPMFWCGVELKRGRQGLPAIESDVTKMQRRCGYSVLETCSLLAWGYSGDPGDSDVRAGIEAMRPAAFCHSRWIYLPMGAYASMDNDVDEWLWLFFGEIKDSDQFSSHAAHRTSIRRRHFAAWQAARATHGYYRGDWPVDDEKCSVVDCARCQSN